MITDETIQYVASLAKLKLDKTEIAEAKLDLDRILGFIDRMNELNTEGIEPKSHIFPLKNVFREDKIIHTADRENLLANAPEQKDGCFKVPSAIEE